MADLKISQLTGATTPLAGTEVVPLVQSGTTKKVAVSDLTAGRAVSAASLSLTTALTVANGGTGATTVTSGQFVQGNGASALSSSTRLYTDGSNLFSDCSYRPQVQSGATNNTAPTALTLSNKTTGAEAAGLGAALEFQYAGSSGGYAGGKIAAVALGDPFTADMVFYPRNYGYAEALRIKSTGDTSFTGGNFVQGTAAKGLNFTANTPAAGMTSQLLNAYEEGTFTPTAAPQTGSLTSYTSTGFYTRVGNQVTVLIQILLVNVGTAAGPMAIGGLPFTTKSLSYATAPVREYNATGVWYFFETDENATTGTVWSSVNGPISWNNNFKYTWSVTYLCV